MLQKMRKQWLTEREIWIYNSFSKLSLLNNINKINLINKSPAVSGLAESEDICSMPEKICVIEGTMVFLTEADGIWLVKTDKNTKPILTEINISFTNVNIIW